MIQSPDDSMIQLAGPRISWPHALFLLFPCLFACALARQRLFHPLFFARLQVEGVTFHFLNDVLLLHLSLKATQGIFERFAFLQSNFCQRNYTPKLSWLNSLVIAR
jgi:hypothetical protein